MNKLLILCVMLAASLAFATCKKKQPAMKSGLEGCDCAKEVSAEFLMEEYAAQPVGYDTIFRQDSDTIKAYKTVRFYALEDGASYIWKIGSEVLYTRTVKRYFGLSTNGLNIPITLIVSKKPNKLCMPFDDGVDTLTRFLYPRIPVSGGVADSLIVEGVFRVYSDAYPDSVDIEIDLQQETCIIKNFEGQGSAARVWDCYSTYRKIWATKAYLSSYLTQPPVIEIYNNYLTGTIWKRLDGVIEMNFTTGGPGGIGTYGTIVYPPSPIRNYNYLGRKI